MKPVLLSVLLTVLSGVAFVGAVDKYPCGLQASVRAEDLSPNHISDGELRVQVKQPNCTSQIVSVALRLQLSEFSEVKYMKNGAFIPRIDPGNQTAAMQSVRWPAGVHYVRYEDEAFEKAKTDPAVWHVKAEHRTAWSTEVLLIENSPNFSQPIVTPFVVISPGVNYPPAAQRHHMFGGEDSMSRHSDTALSYHYVAVVTLDDGRVVEVPAGYTNFVPTSQIPPSSTPVTLNATFETLTCNGDYPLSVPSSNLERCLPEEYRSRFTVEVTLDAGNVVRQGHPIEGRATIHSSGGSTMMDMADLSLVSIRHDHWAHEQAAAGGDTNFASSAPCRTPWSTSLLSPDSPDHAHLFGEHPNYGARPGEQIHLLGASNRAFDFTLPVPPSTVPNSASHYASHQTFLHIGLRVRFNTAHVAQCAQRDGAPVTAFADNDDADALAEAALWNEDTPVGQPAYASTWECKLSTTARVPLTVVPPVHAPQPHADHRARGVPSPVILRARAPVVFPVARPVVRAEPAADTAARLMQASSDAPVFMLSSGCEELELPYPDPAAADRAGCYAGILWKKKLVAEERGLLPARKEPGVEQEGNGQQHFGVRAS
ncbi:hypothetical protein DFH09DRAFT_1328222 [Mycena vulgaris]|nr:hypothetical protein DFH09DRAFT_1328222 [Mycena vulgaris]